MVYLSLFSLSFLAATLLPASSEVGLGALVATGKYMPMMLVTVASLGNILGAVVNWGLGRFALRWRSHRFFPISRKEMAKSRLWYRRYGRWSLLLSWVPIIGDPLTVAAGLLKEPLPSFLLIVGVAKTVRYLVVAYAAVSFA